MARKRATFRFGSEGNTPLHPVRVDGEEISVNAAGIFVYHQTDFDGPYTYYPAHLVQSSVEVEPLQDGDE